MPVSNQGSRKRKKRNGTAAPGQAPPTPPLAMIHKKIAQFASDNPHALEYWLNEEIEAAQLCLEMAASCDHLARQKHSFGGPAQAQAYRQTASILKGHVTAKSALLYFAEFAPPLKLFGLTIAAPKPREAPCLN